MEIESALQILQALADGADPYTSEELSEENIYRDTRTIMALQMAINALTKSAQQQQCRNMLSTNQGSAWSR